MYQSLSDIYACLRRDVGRDALGGFSEDFSNPHQVLHDRFVGDPERQEALSSWLQGKHQPCLFGRLAAKRNGIDYCFLTVDDLLKSDDHIRSKIGAARRVWKNRALRGEPRHGFLLSVCDEKVALATPDETLRQFAVHLQMLAGWKGRPDMNNNDIVDEWLYLRNPKTNQVTKFTFSVDFFATAGDKRWWHDHRVPGGMAFTANSLGHMVRHQEWYEERDTRIEWALRTAMLTIATAAPGVPHGPATYLRDEKYGPLKPYVWTEATKPSDQEKLKGMDCGTYGGYLHTDHAIREEFFVPNEIPKYKNAPYMMDFSYIFDPDSPDHRAFMVGDIASESEVEAELGYAEDMRIIDTGEVRSGDPRVSPLGARVTSALARCREWRLSESEMEALM